MIVEAEAGSIVHPTRPSPVTARHVVGQMLPDIVFGCLDQAIEGGVQAESAGSIWVLAASGGTRARQRGGHVQHHERECRWCRCPPDQEAV